MFPNVSGGHGMHISPNGKRSYLSTMSIISAARVVESPRIHTRSIASLREDRNRERAERRERNSGTTSELPNIEDGNFSVSTPLPRGRKGKKKSKRRRKRRARRKDRNNDESYADIHAEDYKDRSPPRRSNRARSRSPSSSSSSSNEIDIQPMVVEEENIYSDEFEEEFEEMKSPTGKRPATPIIGMAPDRKPITEPKPKVAPSVLTFNPRADDAKEELQRRITDMEYLLRVDLRAPDAYNECCQQTKRAMDFLNKLAGIAAETELLQGAIYQWLLHPNMAPADASMDGSIPRTPQRVTETDPRFEQLSDQVPELASEATFLRGLIRIKIQDDNDIKLTMVALQESYQAFVDVAAYSSIRAYPSAQDCFVQLMEQIPAM